MNATPVREVGFDAELDNTMVKVDVPFVAMTPGENDLEMTGAATVDADAAALDVVKVAGSVCPE